MKPRVAILTDLTDFSPAYSLTGIILDQARMLHDHGYPYELLVLKNFNSDDLEKARSEGLVVSPILAQTRLHPYKTGEGSRPDSDKEVGFERQVAIHLEGTPDKDDVGYLEALKDFDTIISHDLMFLEWFLPQNAAIRKCIEKYPQKNWLHWIHSGPSAKPNGTVYPSTLRYSCAPNSTYVFLNDGQRLECALMLETTRDNIAVVHNTKDVREVYGFAPETCRLISEYDLFNHDLLQIYPFSTPRWESKGVHTLLRLFSEWKKMGVRAKLVLVNAHCNSPQDKPHLKSIEELIGKLGLVIDQDVIMTSRFSEVMRKATTDIEQQHEWSKWQVSVPGKIVKDLGLMTNIFIFPSKTECCSLIQAEAAISGKFFVLNRDFRPMLEFASPKVLTYEFTVNPPGNMKSPYYECVAREIWAEIQTESAVMNATIARNRVYNRDWIFANQFEPLLWKKFSESQKEAMRRSAETKPTAPPRKIKTNTEMPKPIAEGADYSDPKPGMDCPIYWKCTEDQKKKCYEMAGHCLVLDEDLS